MGLSILLAAHAGAFTAFVSNEKSNTISVIDIDKLAVVRTIKVGQRPRGIDLTISSTVAGVAELSRIEFTGPGVGAFPFSFAQNRE